MVTPEEKAYTANSLEKVILFPMLMVTTTKLMPAVMNVMPMAFAINIPAMRKGLSRIRVRLAPVRNRLDIRRKPKGCL